MLCSVLAVILAAYTSTARAFFYKALPLAVVEYRDGRFRAYCNWNDTTDANLSCRASEKAMGYHHKSTPLHERNMINPVVQTLFTQDHCAQLKASYATEKGSVNYCKNYAKCYNLADQHSMCSCQAGFFGDPYVGCKKHCVGNSDCLSPVSYCKDPGNNMLPFCECKSGYQGDGVLCSRDPCGPDRFAKCGADRTKVCVPTGPGDQDFRCTCPYGQFLDFDNKCAAEVTLLEDTVLTLTGRNVENGSRVEAGECLSFTLNEVNKSIFFHKNSGDSIYVRRAIKNDSKFTLFFVLTDDVTAFSQLTDTEFGLTKLYSISNTFKGCKFGQVKVVRPNGVEVVVGEDSTEKVEVHLRSLEKDELLGGITGAGVLPEKVLEGEGNLAEVRPLSATQPERTLATEL